MGIIGTIVIGFLVGLLARFLKPGNDKMGFIMTTVVGIAGAFLGSYLGQLLGIYEVGQPAGFLGAVVGAILVLIMLSAVAKRN